MKFGIIVAFLMFGCSGDNIITLADASSDVKSYNECTDTCDSICASTDDAFDKNHCKVVEPKIPVCQGLCSKECQCSGMKTCQEHCGGVFLCEDPGYLIDGCPVGYACINPEGCIKVGTKL